ncbi:small acid-soluble spore protein H [Bacillus salitolerans]|uniref:Small, acid-soluble spore protein H n=1 Tax=Bacillus salitolerans TaxID=1437434 RepID=A0ABW4LSK8_9BACI
MNVQRAKEIAGSPVMANVSFNGSNIYIQHVDPETETARIFPLDQPEHEQTVSVQELREE